MWSLLQSAHPSSEESGEHTAHVGLGGYRVVHEPDENVNTLEPSLLSKLPYMIVECLEIVSQSVSWENTCAVPLEANCRTPGYYEFPELYL